MKTELRLPLDQAIVASAYQNLMVDQKNDPDETIDDELWSVYLEEAKHLLTTTGENYQGSGIHPTIKLV